MSKVLAALDNSVAAQPVLSTARALAPTLDAQVEAVHVRTDGDGVPARAARAAGVGLRELDGEPVPTLIAAAHEDDVVALVVGARGTPLGKRPLGATALAVATAVGKPVVVVPPDARHPGRLRRVLVPLEGTVSTSLAPRGVIELARETDLDVLIVHVRDAESLPVFTDQPQHEATAWAEEFLARWCPWGVGTARLEVRVGRPEEVVTGVADELDADLVALGWGRQLAAGRGPVVRAALGRTVPVILIPVDEHADELGTHHPELVAAGIA
jgi:nucleotide-binding universal stress UspA family protein